jgi:FkbM family methyltransferase
VTTGLALGVLGAAARWMRRAHLGQALAFAVDRIDGLFLRADRPPLAVAVEGVHLRGYLRHRGFLEYVARGMVDERFYRSLILDALKPRTTFVDAGAHVGLYSILACNTARRVLAFEPDPYNRAALSVNVARCGSPKIEIHAAAVADHAGRGAFRAFRGTLSGSLGAREVEEYRELSAELVCLDDVLADDGLEDLVVKLDVEGAEPRALAGMSETIRRAPELALFVEVNPNALDAAGSSAERLVADLLAAGLQCAFVDEGRRLLQPLNKAAAVEKGNLLCRKCALSRHASGR